MWGEKEEESRRRKFSIFFIITRNSEELGVKRKHLQLTQFRTPSYTWSFHFIPSKSLPCPVLSSHKLSPAFISFFTTGSLFQLCQALSRQVRMTAHCCLISFTQLQWQHWLLQNRDSYARSYLLLYWHLQAILSADGECPIPQVLLNPSVCCTSLLQLPSLQIICF